MFYPSYCIFQDLSTKRTIGSGRVERGLYVLDGDVSGPLAHHTIVSANKAEDIYLWHRRLGHPSFSLLKHLFPSLVLNKNVSDYPCEPCELGKHHRASFAPSINKSSVPFALVHSDVWGPSRVLSSKGHRWFVIFVDDYSRATWLYLMKEKREVFSIFKYFHQMVCTQFDTTLKVLRSDQWGEYIDSGLGDYFRANGIIHQMSCTDTPQQNGVAERKNRHLLDIARSLIFTVNAPKSY